MGKIIFILGGTRSGKSVYAENIAKQYASVAYIATARCTDEEMAERIRKHREQRPASWRTIEEYKNLKAVLKGLDEEAALVDCITVLITNLMFEANIDWDKPDQDALNELEASVLLEIEGLISAAMSSNADLIAVSSEVGLGLVPPYAMGRAFRDYVGKANQLLAKNACEVTMLIAGIPFDLKRP